MVMSRDIFMERRVACTRESIGELCELLSEDTEARCKRPPSKDMRSLLLEDLPNGTGVVLSENSKQHCYVILLTGASVITCIIHGVWAAVTMTNRSMLVHTKDRQTFVSPHNKMLNCLKSDNKPSGSTKS